MPKRKRVNRAATSKLKAMLPRRRRVLLRQAARACERALAQRGVCLQVVGSLAYGDVRAQSDLDLLILKHPEMTWSEVRAVVDEAARPFGVLVDVIFADTLPPTVRQAMLQDARLADDV